MSVVLQQRKYLIKCRQFDVLPSHIYNIKFSATVRSFQVNRKCSNLKKSFQRKLLNLEIKDIHNQIKYLKSKIERMEEYLDSKLPSDILSNFYESNNNKINRHSNKVKTKLINKFNKIKGLQNEALNNFCKMDKSKWIINNSSKMIPDYVMNILSLGDKFGLPIDIKDKHDRMEATLNVIKNFESSCFKFPVNSLDKLRTVIVNLLSKHLYGSKHTNYLAPTF